MATLLGLPTYSAEAKNDKIDPASKTWGWKNARMTVAFLRQADGSYLMRELSDPINPEKKLPIASLAKSMTAIVVLDEIKAGNLKPDQMIPIYPESKVLPDSKFAVVGLSKDWKEIPVHAALTQLLQLSSNTMAKNLAMAVAGSSEKFVSMMNAKATAWEMHDTHFVNEHGLPVGDRKSEHTTARNMIIFAEHMLPYLHVLKSYTNAPVTYWQPPPAPKKPETPYEKDKKTLIAEGALIKTATIDECQSLLTLFPTEDIIVADVQLCSPKYSRFKNALISLRAAFHKIPDMLISNANATSNVVEQSSPRAPPSID